MKKTINDTDHYPRRLTPDELDELRRDMAEASAWIRTEIKRRRSAKIGDLAVEEKQ